MRPSPSKHASDEKVGTISKGNDGHLYIVSERANSIKYWRPLRIFDDKLPKITGNNKIIVTEPSAFDGYISARTGCVLRVTDEFIEVLRKKPKYVTSASGNAYIFGTFYKSKWYYCGSHGNDVAQTGIIALPFKYCPKIQGKSRAEIYKIWLQLYGYTKKTHNRWDDRATIKNVRSEISPNILFVGETNGGDVGASVFAHITRGKIDALVIDNDCIFQGHTVDR